MSEEIAFLLGNFECSRGDLASLRDILLTREIPAERNLQKLQEAEQSLITSINSRDISTETLLPTHYFFLACIYYEFGNYPSAAKFSRLSQLGLWESAINTSLVKLLQGLIYIKMDDHIQSRLCIEDAIKDLKTSALPTSLRAENETKQRESINKMLADIRSALDNYSYFGNPPTERRDTPTATETKPSPVEGSDNSEQTPSAAESETISEAPSYKEAEEFGDYLLVQSMPVFEQNVAASRKGFPLSPLMDHGYTEIKNIILDNHKHLVHSLKNGKSNDRNITIPNLREGTTRLGWVRVVGKSMNKMPGKVSIDEYDFVLVHFDKRPIHRDIVLASIEMEQGDNVRLLVKRFDENDKTLYSETSETGTNYDPLLLEEILNPKIIGVILAVAKQIKSAVSEG